MGGWVSCCFRFQVLSPPMSFVDLIKTDSLGFTVKEDLYAPSAHDGSLSISKAAAALRRPLAGRHGLGFRGFRSLGFRVLKALAWLLSFILDEVNMHYRTSSHILDE